jgi:signal transduction histidine kinase
MQRAEAAGRRRSGRLHWNQDYADVGMALVLTAVALSTAFRDHYRIDPVSLSLLVLQTLPIALRRRDPMRILFITGSAITLYSVLGYLGTNGAGDSNGALGVVVAFYTVAANEPRRRATLAAALTAFCVLVSFAAYAAFDSIAAWTASLGATYLLFGLAWLIGDNLRVRRAYTRELESRAAALEIEREEKAIQAVTEERARIARELHDVVAHYVSVMVVQAAGARRIADKDPVAARGALEAVEAAGRTALAEMRRMLEVLRADDQGMGPQPGLGEIDRLIQNVRDAGLPVDYSVQGEACCLPAGMDLAAYRIVQEALTNTVKHGGKATARVMVRYTEETLEIEVIDDGRGAAAPLLTVAEGGGHGLIGMRERVGLFGGELQTGPVLTGGYRVHARLPIEPDDIARARSERESALAAIEEAAARERRENAKHAQHARRAATRLPEHVKARAVPPMMVRVVPPHPTEESRPRGRRENEDKR